ncbi:uncharacterized protein Dvar_25030 [Desulfosarcina variabilis str. Montpellier]|uniref:hypothetical protein n=1 Tax=Desulfosarcina variabilis TaxID=2300 RepID=UPI003AFB4EF6
MIFLGKKQSDLFSIDLLSLIIANLIYVSIMFIGIIFLIIPGVYIGIKMALFSQAIILEEKRILGSLKRSWELTTNNFWSLLVIGLVYTVPIIDIINFLYIFPNIISTIFQAGINAFFLLWMTLVYTIAFLKLNSNKKSNGEIIYQGN